MESNKTQQEFQLQISIHINFTLAPEHNKVDFRAAISNSITYCGNSCLVYIYCKPLVQYSENFIIGSNNSRWHYHNALGTPRVRQHCFNEIPF